MQKSVLVTGAATGFGRGVALELAKRHKVIAGVEIPPQKTELMAAARSAGVTLEVIVLDITNPRQRAVAFKKDIDILINNAGIMESGPVAEIPMEYVRRNFEVNVFGTLAMIQGVVPQMIRKGSGKIVNVTSMGGLITVPFDSVYTSTKHALEGITEGLKAELTGTGIEVCTCNPGAFGTGFNDRGFESMLEWFEPENSYSNPEVVKQLVAIAQSDAPIPDQYDPQVMIDTIVRVAEEENSLFRNVCPKETEDMIKDIQARTWTARRDDPLMIMPGT